MLLGTDSIKRFRSEARALKSRRGCARNRSDNSARASQEHGNNGLYVKQGVTFSFSNAGAGKLQTLLRLATAAPTQ
jgi:hypothetical protein